MPLCAWPSSIWRERDVGHGVDLAGEQRVDLRGRVGEVDDRDAVEVRLPLRQ